MSRTFTTQDISEVQIEQIIITRNHDEKGQVVVRVRANANVNLVDNLDSTNITTINISLNKTVGELGIGPAVVNIRNAVLAELRKQIN